MKRDMRFVRHILWGIEEKDIDGTGCSESELKDYLKGADYNTEETGTIIRSYLTLLSEEKFIEYKYHSLTGERLEIRLRWPGCYASDKNGLLCCIDKL